MQRKLGFFFIENYLDRLSHQLSDRRNELKDPSQQMRQESDHQDTDLLVNWSLKSGKDHREQR